jgi:O-antigen/teichoic acid export membrane protein
MSSLLAGVRDGLGGATASRGATEVLALGFSALGSILLARAVGPQVLGAYVLATLVGQVTLIAGDCGISQALQVNVGRGRVLLRDALIHSFALRLAASALATAPVAMVALTIVPAEQDQLKMLVFAALLASPLSGLAINWALVAAGRMIALSIVRVAGPLASLIIAAVFVHRPEDTPGIIAYYLAPFALSAILGLAVQFWARRPREHSQGPAASAGDMISGAKHFFMASLAGFAFSSSDRLLLGLLGMQSVLGLYEAANRLITPFFGVFGVIADSHYRPLARADASRDEVGAAATYRSAAMLLLLPTLPVGIGAMLFGQGLIVALFGPTYGDAFPYLVTLGWVVTAAYVAACYTLPLTAWGETARVAGVSVAGAATAWVSGLLLTVPLGGIGAGLSRIAVQLSVGLAAYPARRPYVNRVVRESVTALLPLLVMAALLGGPLASGLGMSQLTGMAIFCLAYAFGAGAMWIVPRVRAASI